MNHTTNLRLPQWEETDLIQRTDFNDAMEKIDAAIPHIATGTYTGTGEYGEEHPNTLTFDFVPKFVLIRMEGTHFDYGLTLFSPLSSGTPSVTGSTISSYDWIDVLWNGQSVSWYNDSSANTQMNKNAATYFYLAIG